jgi:hypothetical protein
MTWDDEVIEMADFRNPRPVPEALLGLEGRGAHREKKRVIKLVMDKRG